MSAVPYAAALGDRDPLKVVAKTPRKLMRLMDDLSDKQIEVHPGPGKWNLREIMAHMADCEIAWSWRLRQAYAKESAKIEPFEQDDWAKSYSSYSLAEAMGCFKSLRKWNLAFLSGLTEKDFRKAVMHPERGQESLLTIVRIMAGHDLHHLKNLEKQVNWQEKDKPTSKDVEPTRHKSANKSKPRK
jgi:uncharacterized damage-inducible protein DinB